MPHLWGLLLGQLAKKMQGVGLQGAEAALSGGMASPDVEADGEVNLQKTERK